MAIAAGSASGPHDLEELGLTKAESAVLVAVVAGQELTAGQLVAATGLSSSHVSAAISGLRRRGVADRVVGRRPAVVFVRAEAGVIVQDLLAESARVRAESAARATAAVALIRAAAARTAERGRPMYEVRPAPDPCAPDHDVLRLGRTSHDEVVLCGPHWWPQHWRPARSCDTRLLVAGSTDDALTDLRHAVEHLSPRRRAMLVRTVAEPLPDLLVLDHERVRIGGSTSQGRVHGWSRDPLHVRWASQLFSTWWESAQHAFTIEPTPVMPFDETGLDVDEWDPADLDPPPEPS